MDDVTERIYEAARKLTREKSEEQNEQTKRRIDQLTQQGEDVQYE